MRKGYPTLKPDSLLPFILKIINNNLIAQNTAFVTIIYLEYTMTI